MNFEHINLVAQKISFALKIIILTSINAITLLHFSTDI